MSGTDRDNRFDLQQLKASQKGFGPGSGVGRAVHQHLSGPVPICEAPDGCTNPGGAFTSERDGRMYEFCSEACRAKFESEPA
jgi:YHS domain-containing protein